MNYEFKGTPGPWRVSYTNIDMETENLYDPLLKDIHCSATISNSEGIALGSTLGIDSKNTSSWVKKDDAIANAYLYAAAPCLLSAAIGLLTAAVNSADYLNTEHDIIVFNRLKQAVEKALNINQ